MPGVHVDGYVSVSLLEMSVVHVASRGHIEDHSLCCHQSLCLVSVVMLQPGTMWIPCGQSVLPHSIILVSRGLASVWGQVDMYAFCAAA